MRILKIFIIGLFRIVYVLIILGHVFYFSIQHPPFFSKVFTQLASYYFSENNAVKDLSVSHVGVTDDAIVMDDVFFNMTVEEKDYNLKFDQILIKRIGSLNNFKGGHVIFYNGFLSAKDFQLEKCAGSFFVRLVLNENMEGKGHINIDQATFKEYLCSHLGFAVNFDEQHIDVSGLNAHFYNGKLNGYGSCFLRPAEKIDLYFSLKDVDTSQVSFFQDKFKGAVNGDFVFNGTRDNVDHFEGAFSSLSGEMSSVVMKYLMGDVGTALSFLPFADVLEKTSFIHVEKLKGSMHNISQDSLLIKTEIDANELSLKLNSSVTINLR